MIETAQSGPIERTLFIHNAQTRLSLNVTNIAARHAKLRGSNTERRYLGRRHGETQFVIVAAGERRLGGGRQRQALEMEAPTPRARREDMAESGREPVGNVDARRGQAAQLE